MLVRVALLFVANLLFNGAVAAADSQADGRPHSCANWRQTAAEQSLMNQCSAEDARRSGRDVVVRYLASRDRLTGGRRNALDATQRAWSRYRDTYCAEKGAAVSGGSMQPLTINSCLDTLNRRRANDLAGDENAP